MSNLNNRYSQTKKTQLRERAAQKELRDQRLRYTPKRAKLFSPAYFFTASGASRSASWNVQMISRAVRLGLDVQKAEKIFAKSAETWLFVADNRADLYQLASNPSLYGRNVECRLAVGSFATVADQRGRRLPWLDLYAAGPSPSAEVDRLGFVRPTACAAGCEVAPRLNADANVVAVPAQGDVPTLVFHPRNGRVVCFAQTERLFGQTVKEAARAWAALNGYSIPLDRVVVCRASFCNDRQPAEEFYADFALFNPELAIACGVAPERIRQIALAQTEQREQKSRIPQLYAELKEKNATKNFEAAAKYFADRSLDAKNELGFQEIIAGAARR